MKKMKHATLLTFAVIITILTISMLIDICEARGGRGRGGGSFGGIFGGWRKYKKPTSNSNSRRTVNGSPMHTTATKTVSSGSSSASSNTLKQPNPQASYPKQQMPLNTGYNSYGGYHGAAGSPPLPQGSTYYPNMGAMPPGAIYYPQPMRSTSGDFLMGMMAGHMTSNLLFGPRHYVTHVHHQNPEQTSQTGPKIIVVNNGGLMNETTDQSTSSPITYWPTDTDTPLEPYNESVTPANALEAGKNPIFQRMKFNNFQNVQTIQAAAAAAAAQPPTTNNMPSNPTSSSSPMPMPPVNGIICMPFLLNETNPNDQSKLQQIERVICFPAPPPPTEAVSSSAAAATATANANCSIRTFIETDPNDPSKTIEVPKEICTTPMSTSEPRQVAGEIGETSETDENFSMQIDTENGKNETVTKEAFSDDAVENATDSTADNK